MIPSFAETFKKKSRQCLGSSGLALSPEGQPTLLCGLLLGLRSGQGEQLVFDAAVLPAPWLGDLPLAVDLRLQNFDQLVLGCPSVFFERIIQVFRLGSVARVAR